MLYKIDDNPQVPESVLGHLDGYKGSRPVRVGNSAAGQLQLDIYGELMDSVYLFNKYGHPIGYDLWEALGRQLDWPEKHWQRWTTGSGRAAASPPLHLLGPDDLGGVRAGDTDWPPARGLPAPIAHWRDIANSSYEAVQRKPGPPGLRPIPRSGAQRTAFTHSGPLGTCQRPRPDIGI